MHWWSDKRLQVFSRGLLLPYIKTWHCGWLVTPAGTEIVINFHTFTCKKKLLSPSTLAQIFINPRSHVSRLCSVFATFRVRSASVWLSVPPLLASSHLHWVNLPCHSIFHSTSEHFPLPLHNLIQRWGSLLWLCCSNEWHALYLCW